MKNDQVFSEGNIALVTGAADGIGLAASLRFARMGLSVVMVDVNPENSLPHFILWKRSLPRARVSKFKH